MKHYQHLLPSFSVTVVFDRWLQDVPSALYKVSTSKIYNSFPLIVLMWLYVERKRLHFNEQFCFEMQDLTR